MGEICFQLLEELMTTEDKTFYSALGAKVAQLRKENHITQVQMAKALKVSQQQIASFEAGRVKIPVSMLPKLSSLFSLSVDEILGIAKANKRGPASRLQKQVEHIGQLPRTKQKFVMEMLDNILGQKAS